MFEKLISGGLSIRHEIARLCQKQPPEVFHTKNGKKGFSTAAKFLRAPFFTEHLHF